MNVVLDIETLSLDPTAVILSLGAVTDVKGFPDQTEFYMEFDWCDQELDGREVTQDTLDWWQEQELQSPGLCPMDGNILLEHGLESFSAWLAHIRSSLAVDEPLHIWARGPQFDIVVLENAFRWHRLPIPWKYKDILDIRTAIHCSSIKELAQPEKKHHALSDAIADMKNLTMRGLAVYGY
jgi:hypothetical protein